jgi:predicted ATPase
MHGAEGVMKAVVAAEVLTEQNVSRFTSTREWLFKHALVHEVVYDTLSLERRREIHGLVGAILETIHPDRIEEHYESLAHHFSHSGRTEKAVEYLGKSGDKAARYFCLRESRRYYNQAIELLEGSPSITMEAALH